MIKLACVLPSALFSSVMFHFTFQVLKKSIEADAEKAKSKVLLGTSITSTDPAPTEVKYHELLFATML